MKKELLEVIVCPKCHGQLIVDEKKNKLACKKCRLRYNIIDGEIPNMIIHEAEKF